MKKNDPPVVTGFRRLSWVIGVLGLMTGFFIALQVTYYLETAALVVFVIGGVFFGLARLLVLVVRGFRVGNDKEIKAVTGFKRLSWFATACLAIVTGIIGASAGNPADGVAAAVIAAFVLFPLFRLLLVWVVRGFAGVSQK